MLQLFVNKNWFGYYKLYNMYDCLGVELDGCRFAHWGWDIMPVGIFERLLLNETVLILIQISRLFIPMSTRQ